MLTLSLVDSLNVLSSQLQASVLHLVSKRGPLAQKVQTLNMELLNFKCEIMKDLLQFVRKASTDSSAQKHLKSQIESSKDRLQRYRLHQILKKKIVKKRRESTLMPQQNSQLPEEISQLQRSMIMIEKDLGIQNQPEEESRLNISNLISRSLAGIQSTPSIKITQHQISMVSQSESIHVDNFSKYTLKSSQRLSSSEYGSSQLTEQKQKKKASNEQKQKQKPLKYSAKVLKEQVPKGTAKKTEIAKKKLNFTQNENKDGLLGNLLQETFQQCVKKQ